MIRSSPTLELAQRVHEAQQRGERAFSFSTPTFGNEADALVLPTGASLRLTSAAGLDELRRIAEAELYGKWQGLGGMTAITAGAKAACFAALRAVAKPGERVLIIAPAWPSYVDICQAAGLEAVLFETSAADNFGINADELQKAVKRFTPTAIIATSPSNPTGRIYSSEEMATLHAAARRTDATLIVDESFSNLVFDEAAWQTSVLADLEHAVVINSFSKNFHLQGLRLGSVMAIPALLDRILAVHQAIVSSAPSASQHLAIQYFKSRNRHAANYHEQRELALTFAARAGWTLTPPQGTFYVFPKLPDAAAFIRDARSRGVHVLAGDAFGSSYANHVRFCFGKPVAELEEVLAALGGISIAA